MFFVLYIYIYMYGQNIEYMRKKKKTNRWFYLNPEIIYLLLVNNLVTQSLSLKSWSKRFHTMNFCRVWAKKLGFSQFKRFDAWVKGIHKQERKCHCVERSPIMTRLITWLMDTGQCSKTSLQYSLLSSRPLSWGTFTYYIGPFQSFGLYTCWSSKPPLEHLSHQTPLSILCELR